MLIWRYKIRSSNWRSWKFHPPENNSKQFMLMLVRLVRILPLLLLWFTVCNDIFRDQVVLYRQGEGRYSSVAKLTRKTSSSSLSYISKICWSLRTTNSFITVVYHKIGGGGAWEAAVVQATEAEAVIITTHQHDPSSFFYYISIYTIRIY